MPVSARMKRVTDPLGDEAKARIFSYVSSSSGSSSDRSASHIITDDDSPCLSGLVHGFLEQYASDTELDGYESDSDPSDQSAESTFAAAEIARLVAMNSFSSSDADADPYRNLLLTHVSRAVEAYYSLQSQQPAVLRRKVAAILREIGHDAAVCTTKWSSSSSPGITAGSYEFIDVIFHSTRESTRLQPTVNIRYFVDLDLASEFKIARPTREYARVMHSLPKVFVGTGEDLKSIVRIACDAAKRSLKNGGLTLPPWRKNRYMQNKWFGPYQRATGTTVSLAPSINAVSSVNCRSVGFDDAVKGSLFVRTR